MSVSAGSGAAGAVLVILGIWLLLQTLVGNFAGRLLGLGKTSNSSGSSVGNAIGRAAKAAAGAAPPLGLGGAPAGKSTTPSNPYLPHIIG